MMKHTLYFYREPGANFIVIHTFLETAVFYVIQSLRANMAWI